MHLGVFLGACPVWNLMLGAEWSAFSGMRLVGALCIWCSKTSVVFVTYVVCQRGDTAQKHTSGAIHMPSITICQCNINNSIHPFFEVVEYICMPYAMKAFHMPGDFVVLSKNCISLLQVCVLIKRMGKVFIVQDALLPPMRWTQ